MLFQLQKSSELEFKEIHISNQSVSALDKFLLATVLNSWIICKTLDSKSIQNCSFERKHIYMCLFKFK